MARRKTVTKHQMEQALAAVSEQGLTVHECIIKPDEVHLIFHNGSEGQIDDQDKIDNVIRPKKWPR